MSAKGSFKETSRFDLEAGISNKSTAAGETTLNEHIPHYELPNVSALLYEYTNKEADLIQRCFKTGNCEGIDQLDNSLRDLPDEMSAVSVMQAQKNKQASNITIKPQPKLIQLMGGGVFSEFEWMPDDYDNFRKQMTQDREEHDEKVKKISSEPWKVGFDSKIEKFKDPFGASGYIFPFFNANDPYEATQDQQLRAKWMKESKILHGDFKPSLADKSLEKVSRSQLSDIVNFIKKTLLEDWSDTNFLIGTNPDDFIEIKFEQSHADAQSGLHAYMNTLVSNHEVISQFNLKKVVQYWGTKIGDYVYFMLSPPWVRTKVTDTYYSLYPDKEPRFAPNL